MRILFVDHETMLGGAEISLVNIVKQLSREHSGLYVALPGPGPLNDALMNAGIQKVFYARLDGWRWWEAGFVKRIKLLLSLPIQVLNVWKWCRLFKNNKPDIIHFNLTRLVEPVIAARFCGIKSVMHCREHESNNVTFFGGIRAHSWLINLCDYWIYNSKNTKESLQGFKKSHVRSKVIPNGIPIEQFGNTDELPGTVSRPKDPMVLMAATLVPWKNHLPAIEVASKVVKENKDVQFVFAGTGSQEYLSKLKKEVSSRNLENNVTFAGFVENIGPLFRSADIVMHTSQKESFGKIYAEAMAASKPVVALRGGAAAEVVVDKKTGFLFELEELDLMAKQINELLRNEKLREEIGNEGKKVAEEQYSMHVHCDRLEEVYQELLGS